jgi:hypothetical protein
MTRTAKLKLTAAAVALWLLLSVGWQVGACELANFELRDDMQDLASQLGGRIGLAAPGSEEDFRNAVIHKAEKYDIELVPEQVTVHRSGSGLNASIFLAADYSRPIHLFGFSFNMHFTPATRNNSP